MVITLIAFMIWIWRKRKTQDRRSTLLTPLSPGATFGGAEKGPYLIDRSSLGPTTFPVKAWTIIGARIRRLRGRVTDIVARSTSPSPSVNLDRGNSQFGVPDTERNQAAAPSGGPSNEKGQFVDWWGRLDEDRDLNWRLRHDSGMSNGPFAPTNSAKETNGSAANIQPNSASNMSSGKNAVGAAATRRPHSRSSNHRRSISIGNEQHFLGGLGLDFAMADPFSDANAVNNSTTKAKPSAASAARNPFSDANAIRGPVTNTVNGGLATYVHDVRRSRENSMAGGISRMTSNASSRRESSASVYTIGPRRNKFRSDPFDLDRPFLHSASSSMPGDNRGANGAGKPNGRAPNAPQPAHVRNPSFSSKYSSGVSSIGGWSDPGPDVGPAAARYTPTPDMERGRPDSTGRRRSGSSHGSVGKAL